MTIEDNKRSYLIYFGKNLEKIRTEKGLSYRQLAQRCDVDFSEISKIEKVKFMWITDGLGWNSVKGGLKDAYNQIEHIYTLTDIEQGLFDKL